LIFEINPNKHTPLFIAPPPKLTLQSKQPYSETVLNSWVR